MPTSNGLSYSMYSLPRSAWTTGALSLPATASSSACASRQPAPPRMVPRFAWPRIVAISDSFFADGAWVGEPPARLGGGGRVVGDVAGDDDDGHAAARDRRLHRDLEDARHLA